MADGIPLFPEEFVGWRGWRVERGQLYSINDDFAWEPYKEVQAVCSKSHKVPFKGCLCGLYAVTTFRKLVKNNYHLYDCFGKVSIWGRMIEGTQGWRAEFGYPKVIYVPYLNWRLEEELREYQVPVVLSNPYNTKDKV